MDTRAGDQIGAEMTNEDRLRTFAKAILEGWPVDDGIGAIELQDIAVEHGLLIPLKVVAACRDDGSCGCYQDDNLPGICYRKTPLLLGVEVVEGTHAGPSEEG